jgi:hypothetical protein
MEMKKVLSLLLPIVFLQSQAFALSGGPVFGTDQTSFIGTYAGALIPQFEPTVPQGNSAALGIFTLGQPDVGPATGSFVAFVNGAAFIGVISGLIDPDGGTIRGVLDASSTFQVTVFVPTTTIVNGVPVTTTTAENFDVMANGELDGRVAPGVSRGGLAVPTTATRVVGSATLNTFFRLNNDGSPQVSKTVIFDIDGFKQSDQFNGTTGFAGFDFNN